MRKALLLPLLLASGCWVAARTPEPRQFQVQGTRFLLDGQPFLLRSGEMHYPRVPRADWRDRLRKMKAMGLNAVCTYVFWNLHEPAPGRYDFTGNLDLAEYVRTAQEEGLLVLLRPGPYICSEWEFGGFPAWLLKTPGLKVRTKDPRFLAPASAFLKEVGRQVAGLQVGRGGPIAMVQVENEYGSYDSDMDYKLAIRKALVDAGFQVPFYTADNPGEQTLKGGAFPDLTPALTFGGQADPSGEFRALDAFRTGMPRMCGEYWTGWFDAYGKAHATTDAREGAQGVTWMLQHGISFNLYMFHGGTNWGFMNGANWIGRYAPDTTSYDYDAMLDEGGRTTPKYFVYREAIAKATGETFPDPPAQVPAAAIPAFTFTASAPLAQLLGTPVASPRPLTMEALDQAYGYVLYRTRPAASATEVLELRDLKDYAVVMTQGRILGTLDRRLRQSCLDVTVAAGQPLDILVENTGRINFTKELASERKGLAGRVTLGDEELQGWENYALPMSDLSGLAFVPGDAPAPAFHRAAFRLSAPADTYLDVSGWGKGQLWINGHNLGRVWSIAPQATLFCPASFLRAGDNEAVVLELENTAQRTMRGVTAPVYRTLP